MWMIETNMPATTPPGVNLLRAIPYVTSATTAKKYWFQNNEPENSSDEHGLTITRENGLLVLTK